MDFDQIFGRRRDLSGDVIPFRRKRPVGEEAFNWKYDIDEEEDTEQRKALNLRDMDEAELKIVVNHPLIHPNVRLYAKLSLKELELMIKPRNMDAATEERWWAAKAALEDKMQEVYREIPDKLKWDLTGRDTSHRTVGIYTVTSIENPEGDLRAYDNKDRAQAYAQELVEAGMSPEITKYGSTLTEEQTEAFLNDW